MPPTLSPGGWRGLAQSCRRYLLSIASTGQQQPAARCPCHRRSGLPARLPAPQVRLVVLRQGTTAALDTSSCPLDIEAQEGDPPAAWIIYVPEREPERLLRWFASGLGGGAARLEFPASLSKRERAWWHGIANRHRLHTESVGVGDGRYLTVSTAAPGGGEEGGEAPEGGAARGAARLTREQQQRANAIYDACQMEGGKYWERSRGEVEALVASGQPLPADLEALADKR